MQRKRKQVDGAAAPVFDQKPLPLAAWQQQSTSFSLALQDFQMDLSGPLCDKITSVLQQRDLDFRVQLLPYSELDRTMAELLTQDGPMPGECFEVKYTAETLTYGVEKKWAQKLLNVLLDAIDSKPSESKSLISLVITALTFDGQIWVPRNVLDRLFGYEHVIAEVVADLMHGGRIKFPLKKHYLQDHHVHAMFSALQSYRFKLTVRNDLKFQVLWKSGLPLDFQGQPLFFITGDMDYWTMDILPDYFTEEHRIRARLRFMDMSPEDLCRQRDFAFKLATQALRARDRDLSSFALREAFYRISKECTQFKCTLALSVIKYFKAQHVLDMCAGWGDRLCGAMAAGVQRYLAFDPNRALEDGHTAMMKMFCPVDQARPLENRRFVVRYEPFEDASLDDSTFDLVFTSPPFFDFEVYNDEATQSINKFPDFRKWLVKFLFVILEKSWNKLRVGGYMVIHMADSPGEPICEPMCLWCAWRLPGCVFAGVLGSVGASKTPRKLWVFTKCSAEPTSEGAEDLLRKIYPTIYNECSQH